MELGFMKSFVTTFLDAHRKTDLMEKVKLTQVGI